MAKPPNKAKSAAPAQFDMNSRDRKGGKDGPRGSGRGRDEKRAPSRIVSLPPSLVDRGEGWVIRKIGKVDQASHAPAGADYELIFDGHDPLVFSYLSAARERAKEPPPEKAQVQDATVDPVEDEDTVAPEAEAEDSQDSPASPVAPD